MIKFTLKEYKILLQLALDYGYKFGNFEESFIHNRSIKLKCLLRHDVDSELAQLSQMAQIESELKIRATYFLMLRSTVYNLYSIEALQIVNELKKLGHSVALHFMPEYHQTGLKNIADWIKKECCLLEDIFGVRVQAFSFHQPSPEIIKARIALPGLINAYSEECLNDYFYVSDSNMDWRGKNIEEIFINGKPPKIQLLIHPMWWTKNRMQTLSKWKNVLSGQQSLIVSHWRKRERTLMRLKTFGAKNRRSR